MCINSLTSIVITFACLSFGGLALKADSNVPTCNYVPEPTSMAPTSADSNYTYFTTNVGGCVGVGVSLQPTNGGYYMSMACWSDPSTGEVCGNPAVGLGKTGLTAQAVCNFIATNPVCIISTTPALCSYVPEPTSMAPTSADSNYSYFTTNVGGCVGVGVSLQALNGGYYLSMACWSDPFNEQVCGQDISGTDKTVVVTQAVCSFIAMNPVCIISTTPALCSYVPEPTSMAPTSANSNYSYFTTTVGGCVGVGVSLQPSIGGYYMSLACWSNPPAADVCGQYMYGTDKTVVVTQAVCSFIATNPVCYISTTPALCSYIPEPTSMAPTSANSDYTYFTTTVGGCVGVGVSLQAQSNGYYWSMACWSDPINGQVCGQDISGTDKTVVVTQAVCSFIATNPVCYANSEPLSNFELPPKRLTKD